MKHQLLAQTAGDSIGWGHMNGWGGGWMWLWGTLMMLSWVVIIAAAVVWASGRTRSGGSGSNARARQILDERYAKGDISTEDYRERIEHLN